MVEKKRFQTPEAEVVRFSEQDIVTTSSETTVTPAPTGAGGGIVLPDDEF